MSSKSQLALLTYFRITQGMLPSSAEEKEAEQQGRQQACLASTTWEWRGFPCVASRVNTSLYAAGGGKLCQVGLGSLLHSAWAHLERGGVCSLSSWIPLSQWMSPGLQA